MLDAQTEILRLLFGNYCTLLWLRSNIHVIFHWRRTVFCIFRDFGGTRGLLFFLCRFYSGPLRRTVIFHRRRVGIFSNSTG